MGVKENVNQANAFVCLRGWSCMCVCVRERVCLCMCVLPYVATLSRGACQDVLHQQLEETNCAAGTVVGRSPSSHPVHNGTEPFCNDLVWWTRTSSSITPDHSQSSRGHCVWAYCKCDTGEEKKAWKSSRTTKRAPLYGFWAAVQVFVFLIWVWFAAGAESDGKYWILPPCCGTCLVNPASPCHSPTLSSPIGDIKSPHPLWVCCPLITISSSLSLFHNFFPPSLPQSRALSVSSSTPSSLCSVEEVLFFCFHGVSLQQAVSLETKHLRYFRK